MHQNMKLLFVYVFLLTLLIFDSLGMRVRRIVGGEPAEVPPPDDPVVYVKHNGKFGRIQGIRNPHEYFYQFRGIRYAEAPVRKQRFQRPKEFLAEGNIDATKYPPPCLQPQPGTDNVIGNEDCLFLNVYTPLLPQGNEGLPVVLWIHGGGYRYGSASQYNVQNLVNKKVVVVTIQYRLGTLGFLSTGNQDLPGNAGLFDMALAVLWTRNYIGFFGGNPNQIVVMGQGSGASSAILVCLSNIAKGLTKGVVAMSGSAVTSWAVDNEPKKFTMEIAERHGCPINNVLIMISCLRAIPADEIIRTDSTIEAKYLTSRGYISGLSGKLTPYPVIEGQHDGRSIPGFIDQVPAKKIADGDAPTIPLLIGVTRDETQNAVNGQFKTEILETLKMWPNYLSQQFVKNLQQLTNDREMPLYDLRPLANYFSHQHNDAKLSLAKIAEATNDVLFNIPAYVTAQQWSRISNSTYLYQFEHLGNSYKGYHFLRGLPIVGNSSLDHETKRFVGHGDDLAFIFTPQNLDGSVLNIRVNETEDDKKVRHIFTDIIYNFAKHGYILLNNKTIQQYSNEKNNYMSISTKPREDNSFRFCQIALWKQILERLETAACKALLTVSQVQTSVQSAGKLFSATADKLSNVGFFG